MNREFIESRITATRTLIVSCEDAISAVIGGAQSYTLDTGQTRQTVTRANITEIRRLIAELENRLGRYERMLSGSGTVHVKAAW